jgi:alanyl aminopeptidase
VRRTLGPALDRIGLQKQSGEDETVTQLRPRLVSWLADEGRDSAVQAYMTTVFKASMSGDETVDPELRSLAVQLACHRGDRALFDSCRARFERSQTPAERDQYLSALGAFRDSAIQEAALQYALTGPLHPQELWDIPTGIASESEAQSDRIFQWFLDHYDELVDKMPPMYRAYLPMIASGCSLTRLERARAFFTDPAHSTPGVESRLARVSDAVNECVSLRNREGGKVAAYLARTSVADPSAGQPANGSSNASGKK